MTIFEIPTLTTDRLRLRAFKASDLDAYAAMQANPEVMRYLIMGRTSTRVEVWRTMATSLGAWALRGYGMWACEKIDDATFVGSVGIFHPLDWPEPEIAYSPDRPFWRQGLATEAARALATGCSPTFSCRERPASFGPTITARSASSKGSAQSANAHSSCAGLPTNIGCITGIGPGGTPKSSNSGGAAYCSSLCSPPSRHRPKKREVF
jgi:hypothetical protein